MKIQRVRALRNFYQKYYRNEENKMSIFLVDEYKDMEDSAFEQVLNDKFEEQYTQWKNDCKVETTETWEQLVIGAVG